jgi:hypothetical protein
MMTQMDDELWNGWYGGFFFFFFFGEKKSRFVLSAAVRREPGRDIQRVTGLSRWTRAFQAFLLPWLIELPALLGKSVFLYCSLVVL